MLTTCTEAGLTGARSHASGVPPRSMTDIDPMSGNSDRNHSHRRARMRWPMEAGPSTIRLRKVLLLIAMLAPWYLQTQTMPSLVSCGHLSNLIYVYAVFICEVVCKYAVDCLECPVFADDRHVPG